MRPLAVAALGMLAGTIVARACGAPSAYIGAIALGLIALFAAFFDRRGLMLLGAFFALSLALFSLRIMEPPAAGRHVVAGRIAETPQQNDGGWTLTLDDVYVDGAARRQRLRLYVRGEAAPFYGQLIETEASLAAPAEKYADSYAFLHISCVGYAYGYTVRGETRDAYGALLGLRERLAAQIDRLFPDGGVAAGMLLGDKSGIADETLDAYRQSGAAHLLAVSGLHVSVLAGAWSLLFRRRAWLRFGLTALFLLLYAALTAFAPSVLRAAVMLLCWQLADPLRMPNDPVSALSLAFIIVLLINPYALFYVGFQLSFLAAYGLALIAPILRDRLRRFGSSLAGTLGGSVAVWVAALPAQAAFFQTTSPASLLSNLFILPLVPFFLIPAFVLTLLSFASFPLANALAFLPRLALRAIDIFARMGAPLVINVPAPTPAALLFYAAGILFASRLCMRSRPRRALYAGACFIAAALFWL